MALGLNDIFVHLFFAWITMVFQPPAWCSGYSGGAKNLVILASLV
jgi:hypothetical protein